MSNLPLKLLWIWCYLQALQVARAKLHHVTTIFSILGCISIGLHYSQLQHINSLLTATSFYHESLFWYIQPREWLFYLLTHSSLRYQFILTHSTHINAFKIQPPKISIKRSLYSLISIEQFNHKLHYNFDMLSPLNPHRIHH